MEGHKCGTDNCRISLGFESFYDCCYSLEEDFCTIENPCGVDQGDCDSNVECLDGLVCGLNNCPISHGYDSEVDCCYNFSVGDPNFCTVDSPCGLNQGDCDSNNECQNNLFCGTNNCPESLGFEAEIDCCSMQIYNGDENYCSTLNPCGVHEGDCDSGNECQTNLVCDTANSCPVNLGFASDINCCLSGCKFQKKIPTYYFLVNILRF